MKNIIEKINESVKRHKIPNKFNDIKTAIKWYGEERVLDVCIDYADMLLMKDFYSNFCISYGHDYNQTLNTKEDIYDDILKSIKYLDYHPTYTEIIATFIESIDKKKSKDFINYIKDKFEIFY